MTPRVLLVDHFDSFAFLLAEQFAVRGAELRCVRAPRTGAGLAACVQDFLPHLVVLSPGPGHPNEATGTVDYLRTRPALPIFGVCLGLQAMVAAAGGEVGPAPAPVHGRASYVTLAEDPLFDGLPRPFAVARYHSLVATRMPDPLRAIATLADPASSALGLVMGLRHRELPWVGVQFHPESVLSPHGGELCARVLAHAMATAAPDTFNPALS